MAWFQRFYLDKEKDMIVDLYREGETLSYVLSTPNHGTGNLIRNLAKLCDISLTQNAGGLLEIRGEVPCYIDGYNRPVYVFRLGDERGNEDAGILFAAENTFSDRINVAFICFRRQFYREQAP